MSKDTATYVLDLPNKLDIVTKYRKDSTRFGFLKPRIPVVEVTTYNPESNVSALKSYAVKPKKRNIAIKIGLGGLIGIVLGGFIK